MFFRLRSFMPKLRHRHKMAAVVAAIKHMRLFEQVQRRTTKYILNDFTSDYKTRLLKLQLLPLMYTFDLSDIILCSSSRVLKITSSRLQHHFCYWKHSTCHSQAYITEVLYCGTLCQLLCITHQLYFNSGVAI